MRRRPGTLKQVILFELYWCALMEITTLPLCKRRLYKTGSCSRGSYRIGRVLELVVQEKKYQIHVTK